MVCVYREPFNSYKPKALTVSERSQIVHPNPFLAPHLETPEDIATCPALDLQLMGDHLYR